ncbi:MAG: arylsulfatase, partial [Verrucomicrobiota bacterium]
MKHFAFSVLIPFFLLFSLLPMKAAERPNIILIMVDDLGFSDLGYMGGEIETPNLDALANGGIRFSQFYNSGRCCPTRATLMTGLHPHQTGIGWMTDPPHKKRSKDEPPAYQGHLNDSCATVAEVLKQAGYTTLMTGKWHLGFDDQSDWPLQRGFDKFFGCISGATRFFSPEYPRGMTLGNENLTELESTTDEAFYTTDAFTDHAIQFIDEHIEENGTDSPYFLYLAYTAPHWPLHAFEDDIAKYRGKYKMGWDQLRRDRFERQRKLGLATERWTLSEKTPGIPDWNSLDGKKQDEMDLKMAVYAAMVDRVDQNIGKLVDQLRENATFDDTLILFLSDNGACQEGGMLGRGEFYDIEKRNRQDANSYGEAWANAGSTPFRLYKHFVHEGGAATPFFLHWPGGIEPQEQWYREPAQLIDVLPTLIDVAAAEYPAERNGEAIPELDGVSLRPAFAGDSLRREEPIFVEHETNAFIRDGKWKLVGKGVSTIGGTDQAKWELYDMDADRTETNDLAGTKRKKVREMAAQWETWANEVGVYPRGKKSPPGPSSTPAPKEKTELKPERFKPQIAKTGFTIRAEVQAKDPHGVVLAQGGNAFGYSLYFEEGVPVFAWRNRSKLTEVRGSEAMAGKGTLEVRITRNRIAMRANGQEAGKAEINGFLAEQPGLGLYL